MPNPSTTQKDEWYYARSDGTQEGPVTQAVLSNMVANGELPDDVFVWREGMDKWREYRHVFAPPEEQAASPPPAAIQAVEHSRQTQLAENKQRLMAMKSKRWKARHGVIEDATIARPHRRTPNSGPAMKVSPMKTWKIAVGVYLLVLAGIAFFPPWRIEMQLEGGGVRDRHSVGYQFIFDGPVGDRRYVASIDWPRFLIPIAVLGVLGGVGLAAMRPRVQPPRQGQD